MNTDERFRVRGDTDDDLASVSFTCRVSPWFIRQFIQAVQLMTIEHNWIYENGDATIEEATIFASEILETLVITPL